MIGKINRVQIHVFFRGTPLNSYTCTALLVGKEMEKIQDVVRQTYQVHFGELPCTVLCFIVTWFGIKVHYIHAWLICITRCKLSLPYTAMCR